MKRQLKLKYEGNVALTLVIVLLVVLLSAGVMISAISIDLSNVVRGSEAKVHLNNLHRICQEETMRRLNFDPNFTGEVAYVNAAGQCSAMVSVGAQAQLRDVELSTQYGAFQDASSFVVDVSTNPMTIVD